MDSARYSYNLNDFIQMISFIATSVISNFSAGLWHATVIYFGTMFVAYFELDVTGEGQTLDLFSFGALNVQIVVLVVSLKVKLCKKISSGNLLMIDS
jgi:hypothetical protein